ncbi:MAG: DUF2510 domain-containing protein, partial [Actinobacteria bacterium]|nr:DUF2510 domain-containing protein [Actinomycetota bacterium]
MSTPSAGWYRDPGDPRQLRFWDGARWGPQTAPFAPFPGYQPEVPPLDATIAAMRSEDPQPWGLRPIVVPIVSMIALITASRL